MVMQAAITPQPEEAMKTKSVGCSYTDEAVKRIGQLYGDPMFGDVTFVVQYEDCPARRFVGHRNIISCWSDPLDAMLCGGFSEGNSSEVRIWDVEPDAFEVMLKMMYSGQVQLTVDNVLAVLDAGARFDVEPLVQFCVQFMQNHTSIEQACMMLEVGVQYGLVRLMDKCIELIVTDDHILESEDFTRLSQAAVVEIAMHDSWNLHEDDIFEKLLRWARANASADSPQEALLGPILKNVRYLHMSVEKLKQLTSSDLVPNDLIFEALFSKLNRSEGPEDVSLLPRSQRPRLGSRLFMWVPTSKVTVSGDFSENAMHTSANGFTGVRGDRRMQQGVYSWSVQIVETQSSWIFVGIAQADDSNDVAWRSSGRSLYCLDARFFHQGSGQNHPSGDQKISSGDCIRVTLDCQKHTLAFGINNERQVVLFQDLPSIAYVPAVDLRDCGDKVRLVSVATAPKTSKSAGVAPAAPTESSAPAAWGAAAAASVAVESLLSEPDANPAEMISNEAAAPRTLPDPPAGRSQQPLLGGVPAVGGGNSRGAGRARAAGRPAPPAADSLLSGSSSSSSVANSDAHLMSGQSLLAPWPASGQSLLAPEAALASTVPAPSPSGSATKASVQKPLSPSGVQAALSSSSRALPGPHLPGARVPLVRPLPARDLQAALAGDPPSAMAFQHAAAADVPASRLEPFQLPFDVPPNIGGLGQSASSGSGLPPLVHSQAAELPPGRLLSGSEVTAALTRPPLSGTDLQAALSAQDASARPTRPPLSGSSVQAALSAQDPPTRPFSGPLSGNEVHAALGLSHPHGASGSSYNRMSQPRQSQGSLGSTSAAWGNSFGDRGQGLSLLEPLSLLADSGEPPGPGEPGLQ